MRLLFDENLSLRLCERLDDIFPSSQQVSSLGLARASDVEIWEYAKREGLVLVTKDSDFHQLSFLLGAPPKVIWLRLGNCSTDLIERALRKNNNTIRSFHADAVASVLLIDRA